MADPVLERRSPRVKVEMNIGGSFGATEILYLWIKEERGIHIDFVAL
jgi:hypothetical protein